MWYSEHDKHVLPLMLVLVVFIAVILAFVLRRKPRWMRGIPTALIALMLIFVEGVKQRWNLRGEFNYFYLPVHYCSLFVLVIPLGELFGKWGARVFRPIATYMAFIVSVGIYIFPKAILGNASATIGQSFYDTHSFIFHYLVILYFVLVLALDLYRPRVADIVKVGAIGLIYAAVAIPMAYIFDTNYCNYLECALPKLDEYRVNSGPIPYTIVITLFISLGAAIASFIYCVVYKILVAVAFCFGIRLPKREIK